MIILFILAMLCGIYEGLKEISMVKSGLITGVKPSKNLIGYLMHE
jgi:hypothetical protein